MTTRIFNALLGIWLFASAFIWPHTSTEMAFTVTAAVLTFVLAIIAIYSGTARYLNVVVAVVLFVSALLLHALTRATSWNNAIVAIAIFASALVDNGPAAFRHEREVYGRV